MTNNIVPKWFLYSSITMNIKVTTKITIDLLAEDQIIENRKTEIEKIFLYSTAWYAHMLIFIYSIS